MTRLLFFKNVSRETFLSVNDKNVVKIFIVVNNNLCYNNKRKYFLKK